MWLVAAVVIGVYAAGSVVVRPFFPNGWLNSATLVVPTCATFAFLLIFRHRSAWMAGMAMLGAAAIAIVLVETAYDKLGIRTIGLCGGLLIAAYSMWSLKGYEQLNVASKES
jgi:hypothetical protein